jgi:hypothetical protein
MESHLRLKSCVWNSAGVVPFVDPFSFNLLARLLIREYSRPLG